MSLARRHRLMMQTQQAVSSAVEKTEQPHLPEMSGRSYALHLDLLAQQKRQLKNCKSLLGKIELKKNLLPDWDDYTHAVLETDAGIQDQIIGQLLIWQIDVGNFDHALRLAGYMLKHRLTLPEHFERDLEDAFAEEMANAWLKTNPPLITLEQLSQTAELVAECDMTDIIRGKLYRALGEAYYEAGDLIQAYQYLANALHYHPNVGCKPLLAKVEKALNAP